MIRMLVDDEVFVGGIGEHACMRGMHSVHSHMDTNDHTKHNMQQSLQH